MKTLLTLASICLFTGATFAQQVFNLKDFWAAQKQQNAPQVMGTGTTSKSPLERLLFDVQPSVEFRNNQKRVTGATPAIVLTSDASSLSKITSMPDRPSKVEMLEILIESKKDLETAVITQAMLDKLSALKFIFFKSEVACTAADIKKLIPATLTGITVLFDVQQPS